MRHTAVASVGHIDKQVVKNPAFLLVRLGIAWPHDEQRQRDAQAASSDLCRLGIIRWHEDKRLAASIELGSEGQTSMLHVYLCWHWTAPYADRQIDVTQERGRLWESLEALVSDPVDFERCIY